MIRSPSDQVGEEDVVDLLQQHGHSIQAGSGVDVLRRQITDNVIGLVL